MPVGALSSEKLLSLVPAKLMTGAAWNALAQVMYRGLVILAMLIAARLLGLEPFGQLSLLYNTAMTFHVVASLGLIMTGTKLVAEFAKTDKVKTGRIMALCHYIALISGGLVALLMLLTAPWIADTVLNEPSLVTGVRLIALLLFFQVLADSTLGINLGFLAFRGIFVANALTGICALFFLVAGVYGWGIVGGLLGLSAAEAVRFGMLYRLAHRSADENGIPRTWRFPSEELSVLWHVSLPAMATLLLWLPVTWIGTLMLVREPGGFGEMGLFGAANQWFSLLMFVPGVITQTILPILSEQVSAGGRTEARHLALRSAAIMLVLVALIALPLMVGSPLIASAYGPDFADGALVFILMFAVAITAAPQGILSNYLAAENRFWLRFRLNVLWAICYLIAAYSLVSHGAVGLTSAMIIAYAVRTLATLLHVLVKKSEPGL